MSNPSKSPSKTNTGISPKGTGNVPNLISVGTAPSNISSPAAQTSSSNCNTAPIGVAINGLCDLSLDPPPPPMVANKPTPTAPASQVHPVPQVIAICSAVRPPPADNENAPKRRKPNALVPPASFNSLEYASILPAPPSSALALVPPSGPPLPNLVLKSLPHTVDSDSVETVLRAEGLSFTHITGFPEAGRAVISFPSYVDYELALRHTWPWGTIDELAIQDPYADYISYFRLAFVAKINHLVNPLVEIAGGLAALGVRVLSVGSSPSLLNVLNVYVASLQDYKTALDYDGNVIIAGVDGKENTILLHRKHLSASNSPLVKRLHVAPISPQDTESSVLARIRDVVADQSHSQFRSEDVLVFSQHYSKDPKVANKKSPFGFLQVVGAGLADFLAHNERQPFFGSFKVSALRPKNQPQA